jgi:hypothetical protein
MIYFIGCGAFAKIGHTQTDDADSVAKRLRALECQTPYPVRLIAAFPGGAHNERWLHARFLHLHHRDEWFRLGPDLLAFIAGLNGGTEVLGTQAKCTLPIRWWKSGRKPRLAA